MAAVPTVVELNVTVHEPPAPVVQLGDTVPKFVVNETNTPDVLFEICIVIVDDCDVVMTAGFADNDNEATLPV